MPRSDGSIVIDTKILKDGFSKGISGLKSMAVAGGVAIGAGIGVAAVAFVKFASAAEDAAVSDQRLTTITKNTRLFGNEASKVTKRLIDYSSALSKQIGVDDDSIKRTQAKLLTFKDLAKSADTVGGSFDRATQAAYDMAAAGFGDAENNAILLGKALQDPIKGVTALARNGVTLTQSQKDMIKSMVKAGDTAGAQDLILKAIENDNAIGGVAAKTVKASDQMKVAYGELEESIGAKLLPSFKDISQGLTGLMNGDAGAGAQLAKGLTDGVTAFVGVLPTVLPSLITALTGIIIALATALPGIITAVMPALIEGFKAIVTALPKILPPLIEGLAAVILMLAEAMPEIMPLLADSFMLLITVLAEQLGLMAPVLIPVLLRALQLMFFAIAKQAPKFGKAALVLIGGLAVGLGTGLVGLVKKGPGMWAKLLAPLVAKTAEWRQSGKNLITGLWSGITNKFDWLVGKLRSFATDVTSKLKAFFKIESPSKLFRDEIGVQLAMGVGVGFTDAVPKVFGSMRRSLGSEMGRLSGGLAASNGGTAGVGAAAASVSGDRIINFNQPVRTYAEVVSAMNDIERGLAF